MKRPLALATLLLFAATSAACGGAGEAVSNDEAAEASPQGLTFEQLSDGEKVWCQDNVKHLVQAAETLGIEPMAVITGKEPKYKTGPMGSRHAFDTKTFYDDIDAANGRPAVIRSNFGQGYLAEFDPTSDRWPIYKMGFVTATVDDPWVWFDAEDFPRACRAAYEAR